MLIRLAIDPAGVGMEGHDAALQSKLIDDCVTSWMRCGIVYIGTADYAHSPLRLALEGLPQALKSRWIRAVTLAQQRGLLRNGPPPWLGSFQEPPFDQLVELRHGVDVVGIGMAIAGSLGFAPHEPAQVHDASAIELCRLDCLSASSRIRKADEIREQKKFKRGEKVDTIWTELFRPFVARFSQIALVDRFCLHRLAECASGESGIERFLGRVDACPGDSSIVSVQVLSTLARCQSRGDVVKRLRDVVESLPNGRISSLEVQLVDERAFGPVVHYRYARFQSHHCIILDHGIEILEGHSLRRTHPYSLTYFDETLRTDETALRAKAQRCIVYSRPKSDAACALPTPPVAHVRPGPGMVRVAGR